MAQTLNTRTLDPPWHRFRWLTLRSSWRCSTQSPRPPESHHTYDCHFSAGSPSTAIHQLSPPSFPPRSVNSVGLGHRPQLERKAEGRQAEISFKSVKPCNPDSCLFEATEIFKQAEIPNFQTGKFLQNDALEILDPMTEYSMASP